MATTYTRRINLYINGREARNDTASIRAELNKLTAQNDARYQLQQALKWQPGD